MFDALRQRLETYLRSLVPVRSVTRYNALAEQSYQAASLDAAGLHTALRSAEGGDVRQLFAIYRDTILSDNHVQTEFSKRKLAVLGDTMSVLPLDKKNADDTAAADFIRGQIEDLSGWTKALAHLQDSILWPVSVVEKVYRPTGGSFVLDSLVPVPHELLDFSSGRLRILPTDERGWPRYNAGEDPDPRRYIIHRNHLLSTPDHWGGPMRSILFWWLLGAMDRDWWARFLDRYGSPFLVGKYDSNDDASRSVLERAFSAAVRIGGLVVTRDTNVEIQQAAAGASGDAFEKFYTISRREISKLIVGQTLSSEAQSTGLGSGVANTQAGVRDDYRQFDAKTIAETLRDQLFRQICDINGLRGGVPRLSWGGVSVAESKATGDLLESLSRAGLRIADEGLPQISDKLGLPIERAEGAAPAFPGLPPAALMALAASATDRALLGDEAVDSVARAGAADLARAFRSDLAPLRRLILASRSPADLEDRMRDFLATTTPASARVLEEAMIALAANGAAR